MGVSPLYTIHQYREDFYKVVAFKGLRDPDIGYLRSEPKNKNDTKLANNFSRARSMVLQYALCNPWDYFFTGTLDPERWNRDDLDKFMIDFSQKIRDWRKAYNSQLQVLLIPENHKDGTWHVHGLIRGLPSWHLYRFWWMPLRFLELKASENSDDVIKALFPWKLCQNDEWRYWDDFSDRYGYCSLAPIKDPVATAFYVTKYISKDISQREGDLGKHLYFHSRPLRKAEAVSDVYAFTPELDEICTEDFDFCKTGMIENVPWYFPYMWDYSDFDLPPLDPPPAPELVKDPLANFDPATVDPFYEQVTFKELISK